MSSVTLPVLSTSSCRQTPHKHVDHLKQTGEWENIYRPPTALTSYDKDSIMNYCNAIWNNNGRLSDGDVKAIQILFPK